MSYRSKHHGKPGKGHRGRHSRSPLARLHRTPRARAMAVLADLVLRDFNASAARWAESLDAYMLAPRRTT